MKEKYFENQVAVITGAGGTLCSVIAKDLAARGAKVALISRSIEKLAPVRDAIRASGGTAEAFPADVTDENAVKAAAHAVQKKFGTCRFLVNGAGGNQQEALTTATAFDPRELQSPPPENFRGFFNLLPSVMEDVLRINLMGTILPIQVFGREMAAAKQGCILNFASMNSYRPLSRVLAYAAAKAAVLNMTQWFATYLASAHIRVNAIAPGFFVNDRSKKYLMTPDGGLSSRGEQVMRHTPDGTFGNPEDLLGCVRWLLNDEQARFVTGITVPVDGGFLACSGI